MLEPIEKSIILLQNTKNQSQIYSNVSWSSNKEYRCWTCTLNANPEWNIPIGCPIESEKMENETKFHVVGFFCCWSCAMGYAKTHKSHPLFLNSISLLYEMNYLVTGNKKEKIIPSPPRELLTYYGGPMSPEVYRERIGRNIYKEADPSILIQNPTTLVFNHVAHYL